MKERVLAPGKERLRNLAGKTLGHMHRYLSAPSIKRKKKKKKREKRNDVYKNIIRLSSRCQSTIYMSNSPFTLP